MRKQTKLVAVLSAAALLAIGASMTSFAAAHWDQQDGEWVFVDRNGDRMTDVWKKVQRTVVLLRQRRLHGKKSRLSRMTKINTM